MTTHEQTISKIKRAELLSSIGAGVLGAGIALLWMNFLAPYGVLILLLGLVAHSGGMFKKHQLEQQHSQHTRILWVEALYWICWAGIAVLIIFIIIRSI